MISIFGLALLAGCASSEITNRRSDAAQERIPRPGRIIVYDIGASPGDVPPSAAITGHYNYRPTPQTEQEIQQGRKLGAQVSFGLVEEILKMGMPAQRAGNGPPPQEYFVAGRPGEIGDADHSGSLVMNAASDGRIPVVIRGDPFAGNVSNPNSIVAAALRLPPGFSRASFVKTPQAEAGRGERLVLVFDAKDGNLDVRRMCRDLGAVEVGAPDGRLRLAAAFCIGRRLARGAVGATTRARSR